MLTRTETPRAASPVQFVPEVAARLRIDAGRRLVEQEQLGVVEHARGEGEPLLPAARQRSGELPGARRRVPGRRAPRPRHATARHLVQPRDEIQVLADGQVLPEREALGHVPDASFDLVLLTAEVEAEARALPRIRSEQPAHHADGRGLAAAVRPEEPEDLAALDAHGHVVDYQFLAEALGQPAHVNRICAAAPPGSWAYGPRPAVLAEVRVRLLLSDAPRS